MWTHWRSIGLRTFPNNILNVLNKTTRRNTAKDRWSSFDASAAAFVYLGHAMDLPALRTIPFLYRNGLVRTDNVLAYSQHGWPMISVLAYDQCGSPCGPGDVGTGWTTGRTENGTDKVKI